MAFTLGLAQCRHPEDGNVLAMAKRWMEQACDAGVDLLVFPESLMTPYESGSAEFAAAAEPLDGPFCTAMCELAREHGLWVLFTANEAAGEGRPFNTAVMVDDEGRQRAVYRKVHLFDTDFTRESDKVQAGEVLPVVVDTPFGKIGMAICYDLRFPELARAAALAGCDVLVYPAAWVDGPMKVDHWETLLRARAIENQIFVAGLSRCDRDFGSAHRDYAGHSCVFDPMGRQLASAGVEEKLVCAVVDIAHIAAVRAAMPVFDHRRPSLY